MPKLLALLEKKLNLNLINNQSGYMWYFLIVGVIFVMAFLAKATYTPPPPGTGSTPCMYNPPLQTETFQDGGANFDLIKKHAPIIGVQYDIHLERQRDLAKEITIDGKQRLVTRTEAESGVSNWLIGEPDKDGRWKDVRFIDMSDEVKSDIPGTKYVNIYIRRGSPIPEQIIAFCANHTGEPKSFLSDDQDRSFPPKEIDAATISEWQCAPPADPASGADCQEKRAQAPRDGTYYLYAYDNNDMAPIDFVKRTGIMPSAGISINDQSYTIVYYGGWESRHLRLETTDPETGQEIGYRYANPERLRIPEDPYQFLNTTETATGTLQLQAFTPWQIPPAGWWTPECKPAIYLYPKTAMTINVKVNPQGHFTYTDPVYDFKKGWNVKAYPTGKLEWLDNVYGLNSKGEKRTTNIYEYLYYESKIHDSMINKPTEGFVVAYTDLADFYTELLPKLGLNNKETADYIDYWQKALPYSPYYFIGILSRENIDQIEPMQITPNPDVINRVRLYYEALDTPKEVKAPVLNNYTKINQQSSNLTVTEWGGMVKQDKNHPFTCSI